MLEKWSDRQEKETREEEEGGERERGGEERGARDRGVCTAQRNKTDTKKEAAEKHAAVFRGV